LENNLYKKILIATDGSENSRNSVKLGIQIAKSTGAEVHAVTVVPSLSLPTQMKTHIEELDSPYCTIKQVANKAIGHVIDIGKKEDIHVKGVILEGHPPDQLTCYAHANDFDLIVLGSLGRTGFERFLIGSVAEKVVRHSKIKVLVVPSSKKKKEDD